MRVRLYICITVCFILLLTAAFPITSGHSQQNNTTSATGRAGARRQSSNSNRHRRSRSRRTGGGQAARSHCHDSPPANPSRCNINQRFDVGCDLPFSGGESHDIDQHCPNEGCANRPADKAQNRIKNNLCATGTPVQISFNSIDRLQRAVNRMVQNGQLNGSPPPPDDRTKLRGLSTVDKAGNAITLGEGDLVTLEAFVLDAKHDDTFPFGFGGEGVNCKNSLLEWNDIHIALGQKATSRECSSVTAEIIPHFRPPLWDRIDSNACTARHVTNPLPVKRLRVRITGQLFFDGSHVPSSCSAPAGGGNPKRRSVWEIHPVYKIEVFSGSDFISFENWAANH